ncbi:MAG: hypothetical protein AAF720_15760 [Pseudomonadota bacterium]
MLQMFPLLAVSLIVYTGLTFALAAAGGAPWVDIQLVALPLASNEQWAITGGDVFLVVSMGLLFVELVRATQTNTSAIANHGLSFLLFLAGLLAFIFVKGFGNSTFFIYLSMTFLDAMAGMVVTTVTARRDLSVTESSALR